MESTEKKLTGKSVDVLSISYCRFHFQSQAASLQGRVGVPGSSPWCPGVLGGKTVAGRRAPATLWRAWKVRVLRCPAASHRAAQSLLLLQRELRMERKKVPPEISKRGGGFAVGHVR